MERGRMRRLRAGLRGPRTRGAGPAPPSGYYGPGACAARLSGRDGGGAAFRSGPGDGAGEESGSRRVSSRDERQVRSKIAAARGAERLSLTKMIERPASRAPSTAL